MSDPGVLITGGAGFIGSHLVDLLLQQGRRVTVVDDLSTGRRENLAHHADHERAGTLRFIHAALPEAIDVLQGDQPGLIVHLAAAVGVRRVVEQPIDSIEANIAPTAAILDFARTRRPMPRVIIASSSEVYGKSSDLPFREDGDCVFGPTTSMRWSYAASKAIDEYLALAHYAQHDLPATIVRLFNTVGPRQVGEYGMVLPRFVRAALDAQPLTVYGDGQQSRSFCDVRDVVPAIATLAQASSTAGGVYNVGSDRPITVRALAERVIEVLASRSGLEFVPYDRVYGQGFEDPPARVPDLSRIREAVSFNPAIPLDDTIRDIAAEMSARPSQPPAGRSTTPTP